MTVKTICAVVVVALMAGTAAWAKKKRPPLKSYYYYVPGESHPVDEPFETPECTRLTKKTRAKLSKLKCDRKWEKTNADVRALRCADESADTYYYFFKTADACETDREAFLSGEP